MVAACSTGQVGNVHGLSGQDRLGSRRLILATPDKNDIHELNSVHHPLGHTSAPRGTEVDPFPSLPRFPT